VRIPALKVALRRVWGAVVPPAANSSRAAGLPRPHLRAPRVRVPRIRIPLVGVARDLVVRFDTRQDGQLTVLLVGLVLLVLMVLALGWDTSNWLIGRRTLSDLADGAAAAAAGAVDVERFYGSGGRVLRLDEAAATGTVREVLAASPLDGIVARVSTGVGSDGRPRATVQLRAPASTAFLHVLGLVAPEMSAEAVATAVRVEPPGQ
jgi:Putative Flp pilus-assembly TadE/G-like